MAADKSSKTEKPTAKKLEKAREEGQVPQSQELVGAISLIVLLGTTAIMGPKVTDWFSLQIRESLSCNTAVFTDAGTFLSFLQTKLIGYSIIVSPFFIALAVAGVAGSIVCGGCTLTAKPLKPTMKSLNPVKGLKQLVGLSSLVKLGISVVKLIFVGAIVYFYFKDRLEVLAGIRWAWSYEILSSIGGLIFGACIRICIGLLVIGVIDLIYQRWKYIKDLKMTKQEIKEEHKSYEGSPEVKKRIRQTQFNMAMKRMMKEVPTADVVLVNPTHYAVALRYNSDKMLAPIVVAKGADNLCEKIKEVARAYGVPIVRKPQIARTIYHTVDVDHPIPENLFMAVAEILAMIYRLRHGRR